MERNEVIQALINKRKLKTYLEIGVSGGRVFFKIRCKKKIAVDPFFRFNWKGKIDEISRNITNINNRYFELISDDFFLNHADKLFKRSKIDICLVDGMHEFSYALNDVSNTLKYMSEDGIIIMHDCNPKSEAAECSFSKWKDRNFTGLWNGDVWKVILYLRNFRRDLDIFVADCDHGLGIITYGRKNDDQLPEFKTFEEINALTYQHLEENRSAYLNLKPVSFLMEFLQCEDTRVAP